MAFCYKMITFKDLPDKVSTPLALAVDELPEDIPLILLQDSTPEKADITKKSRVNGFCTFAPKFVVIVVRELSKTLVTLYHEYEHYSVHMKVFERKGWMPPTHKQMKLIEQVLEDHSDLEGDKGLKAFKKKYPDLFAKGEAFSRQWMKENKFSEYNESQPIPPEDVLLDWTEAVRVLRNEKAV